MANSTKTKKLDLRRVRESVGYFAERLLRFPLRDYQLAVLEDPAASVIWPGGRGIGKTVALCVLALWFLFTKRNSLVAYVAATERQHKIAHDKTLGMIAGTELWSEVVEESYDRIRLANGSTMYFLPGQNEVSVRGLHAQLVRAGEKPTDVLLILDEAASIPHATVVASMGILATVPKERRKRFVTGSPRNIGSMFHREFLAGLDPLEKYTSSHTTNAEGIANEELVDELKQKLTGPEYDAEVRGLFVEGLSCFFAGFVDDAIGGYSLPVPSVELADVRRGDVQYSLGADLSSSARIGSDFTTFCVVVQHWKDEGEREIRICDLRRFQYLSHEGIKHELQDIKKRYPHIRELTCETYESMQLEAILGPGPDRVNVKPNFQSASNPQQHETLNYFHSLLRSNVLKLPYSGTTDADRAAVRQLVRELKAFQYRTTEAGTVVFGHPERGGLHDDLVYCLNWAIHGLPKTKKARGRSARRPW